MRPAARDHQGAAYDALVARLRAAGCVFAEEEAAVLLDGGLGGGPDSGLGGSALEALVARRVAGEPLEHVVGWVDFAGLRLRVDPGVFVPRQRSVLLVEEGLRLLPTDPAPAVVELCCGAGAVSAALVAARPDLRLWAGDVDPAAVACARANLPGAASVAVADLDDALPASLAGTVDLVVAHVPYVPTGELALLPPEAREHEPRAALDGGPDGLAVLRRVAARAGRWLRPGGAVLCEVGAGQVAAAAAAYRSSGLLPRVVADDDRGARVLVGTRPAIR